MPPEKTSHLEDLVHDAIPTLNVRQLAGLMLEISQQLRDRGLTPHLHPRRQDLQLNDDKGDQFASMTHDGTSAPIWKTWHPQTHPQTPLDKLTP